MFDDETGSVWSHLDGRALTGPLAGEQLRVLPLQSTTWSAWLAEHPDSSTPDLQDTALAWVAGYEEATGRPFEDRLALGSDELGSSFRDSLDEIDPRLPANQLVIGALAGLLTLVKGLPMAYNRDLQEDRTLLFPAVETTLGCVGVTTRMVEGWTIHRDRFEDALRHDASLATEIADYLVCKSIPFREAHHVSGQMVRWCEEQGGGFEKLTPDVLSDFHPALEADVFEWLNPREAIARRTSHGGTAWSEVMRQAELLREG